MMHEKKGESLLTLLEFCEEITRLGFHVMFKNIDYQPIVSIWIPAEEGNHLIPLGHVNQNQTDYFIRYNDAWKAMSFEKQKQIVRLMKAFCVYK